jgi:hypothetical protein
MALYQIVEKQDDARQNNKLEKLPCDEWRFREGLTESSISMTITVKPLGGFVGNFSILVQLLGPRRWMKGRGNGK